MTRISTARALRALTSLGLLLSLSVASTGTTAAAANLTLVPVTWNVIGLDSNNVNVGPNKFPVGARICNTGDAAATDIQADFVWAGAGTVTLTLEGAASLSLGSLDPATCIDAMYTVVVPRASASWNKARPYRIDVTAAGGISLSTPTPRELYVEKLVSQNRNTTLAIAGPGGCPGAFGSFTGCDPVPTMSPGNTYTIKLYGSTSTAYSQLESFITFPNTILQVLRSSSTYTVGTDLASDSLYSDACDWVNDPTDTTTPAYRECSAVGDSGGNVVVTYLVKAIAVGSGSATAVFYDFSGSSYHYNSDYGNLTLNVVVSDPGQPGTLSVTEAPVAGVTGNYTVSYACDTTSGTMTIPAGGTVSVTVPPPTPANCTVTQLTRPAAPAGYTWGGTTYDPSSGVTVEGGLASSITVNNAISAGPGTLTINVGDVASFTGAFSVTYVCTPDVGAVQTATVSITDGASRTITGLTTPTSCTISSVTPPAAPGGFSWSGPSYGPQTVAIGAGGSGTVAVSYTLTPIPVTPPPPAAPTPGLTVAKTASLAKDGPWTGSLETEAGTAVWYRIVLTNSGGVALTGLSVKDSLTGDETPEGCPALPASLAPGVSWTCTYSVEAAEGTTTNTVTADSDQTGPATASAEVFGAEGEALPATDLSDLLGPGALQRYAPIGLGLLFVVLLVALAMGLPGRKDEQPR